MNFKELKEALRLCRASRITSCVWGHKGIGKSEVIAQITKAGDGEKTPDGNPLPIGFIDFRCSQIEAVDLRGMPDRQDGRTIYCPPADMPVADMTALEIHEELSKIEDPEERRVKQIQMQPRYKKGILFLDEINRAQDDVLQTVFQLILDLRIGTYVVPAGWTIAIACNYMEGDYITNGFTDAAFLDRLCHLHLIIGEGTLGEWCAFMADKHGDLSSGIIQYCASNLDNLTGQVNGELGFVIQPSPRSWDKVAQVEAIASKSEYNPIAKRAVISGLVGQAAALAYESFTCPVQPADIVRQGVNRHARKLKSLNRNELMGVSWGLISYIRNDMDNQRIVSIALDFAELLVDSHEVRDKDVVVAFCRALLGNADDNADLAACITNREIAGQLVTFYESHVLLQELYKREKFHNKLAEAGWGE